jgi:hypothetical protein
LKGMTSFTDYFQLPRGLKRLWRRKGFAPWVRKEWPGEDGFWWIMRM